jgi:uncharacterized protein (TIGR03086 family)
MAGPRSMRQALVMTEIADRYRRLSAAFADRIAGVPDDAWDTPTPCADWSVRDLVSHVVATQGMFRGLVGRDTPEVDPATDPLGAWATVSGLVQSDLDDPERAGTTFEGHFGTQSFEQAVDRFLNFDLVVHGWDLARATGQDTTIEPEDLERVAVGAAAFGDAMRGPGAFGPEVDPPPDADEQAKLVAFLGRQV